MAAAAAGLAGAAAGLAGAAAGLAGAAAGLAGVGAGMEAAPAADEVEAALAADEVEAALAPDAEGVDREGCELAVPTAWGAGWEAGGDTAWDLLAAGKVLPEAAPTALAPAGA